MLDGKRQTRTVTLEVDSFSNPIRGIARDELGVERPFTGWIGLASALEHTLDIRDRNQNETALDDEREVGS